MGGREFRATLLFVLISLVVGAGYRSWIGPEGPTFVERLRRMEEASALQGEAAGAGPHLASSRSEVEPGPRQSNPRVGKARERTAAAVLGRLDPDRASTADWERLPGIGPSLAARIVADRDSRGAFGGPEGLLRVRGIGPKTLDRIRPFLRPAPVDSVSPSAN